MDLDTWATIVGVGKDVVTACAALVGAGVAVWGVNAWRVQLLGKAEHDLAKKILLAVYEVENKVLLYRNQVTTSGEAREAAEKAGIKRPEGDNSEFDEAAYRAARDQRMAEVFGALAHLRKELFEARALWGDSALEGAAELEAVVRELYGGHLRYRRYTKERRVRVTEEQWAKVEQLVFDQGDRTSPDSFTARVASAVMKAETELRPKLGR